MVEAVAYLSLSLQPNKQGGENQFTALFVVSLCVKATIQIGANTEGSNIYASGLYKPIQFPLGSRNIAKAPLPPGITLGGTQVLPPRLSAFSSDF